MKKVKSERFENIHYYAQCDDCDWDETIGKTKNTQYVRNKIIQHIKRTGHNVRLEKGSSIQYFLEKL